MKWPIALVTVTAAMNVAAAASPATVCPPVAGASQPAAKTAPTTQAERLADVSPAKTDRTEAVAVPQVTVPLKLAVPDATALKPGRQEAKSTGQVDEAAARCRAARP